MCVSEETRSTGSPNTGGRRGVQAPAIRDLRDGTVSPASGRPLLQCMLRREQVHLGLILFPHAGGNPSAYDGWAEAFPPTFELWAVHLPGRAARSGERAYTSAAELCENMISQLRDHGLLSVPLAFFGHSFGALIAYETARLMQSRNMPLPVSLLLSSHGAPSECLPHAQRGLSTRGDVALFRALRMWGFHTSELKDVSQDVLPQLLAPLRTDLALREDIVRKLSLWPSKVEPLHTCVHVFGGDRDRSVEPAELARWREHFVPPALAHDADERTGFSLVLLPGGHFYAWQLEASEDDEEVATSRAALIEAMRNRIALALAARPSSLLVGQSLPMPALYMHEQVLMWAERTPGATAVIHERGELTYAQLAEEARLLACWFVAHGAGPDLNVASLLEHRYEFLLAQLAAGLAAAGFFAMETHFGPQMLVELLKQTTPVCAVVSAKTAARLTAASASLPLINVDTQWREQAANEAARVPRPSQWPRARPFDTGIITMTSGTTGTPKTILCTYAAYSLSISARASIVPYTHADPEDADAALREREASNVMFVWEAARPLCFGHISVVIADEVLIDTARLAAFLHEQKVTRVLGTPSLLATFIDTLPSAGLPAGALDPLRVWMLCGEVVPSSLVKSAAAALPRLTLVNDYSSWEGSDTAYATISAERESHSGFVDGVARFAPIGTPPPGVSVAVLDPDTLEPVPAGVPGELYVASPMLFLGYGGSAELTRERLLPVPAKLQRSLGLADDSESRRLALTHAEAVSRLALTNAPASASDTLAPSTPFGACGEAGSDGDVCGDKAAAADTLAPLMYKTGDAARLLPSGQLQVSGRIDSTVKIRGFKVGLSYVEATIMALPSVSRAAVVSLIDEETGLPTALVAHVAPAAAALAAAEADEGAWLNSVREACRSELPAHALPRHWMLTRSLLMSKGESKKIDRSMLPKPKIDAAPPSAAPVAALPASGGSPAARLERELLPIWCSVLGVAHVSPTDNFFDIGGHSLLAAKLVAAISSRLSRKVTVLDLFDAPSARQLAEALAPSEEPLEVAAAPPVFGVAQSNELSIIGMAGRFPGASDVRAFWKLLREGQHARTLWSRADLAAKGVSADVYNHPRYVPAAYMVEGAERFDSVFWGLSPHESAIMDPQHRTFMEVSWAAFENAGYAPRSGTPKRTAVVAAPGIDGYMHHHLGGMPLKDALSPADIFLGEVGSEKDYIATRVSFALDLMGPSIAVNSACSSALAAVAQAAQMLLTGQADMALGGAAALSFPNQGYLYEDGLVFSRDGLIRPFDAAASGTVFGDAIGAVVLKRRADAQRDGDTTLATINGFGVTNDGARRAGFSAPGVSGQREAVVSALRMAGVSASSVSFVECHATATLVGDGIEVRALTEAFAEQGAGAGGAGYCAIGSVKGNIGHANAAAGVTGLIKAAMSLSQATLVPTANFTKLNANVHLTGGPFAVNGVLCPWPRAAQAASPHRVHPRRAGVSSFGIGGTDVHVLLQESPADADGADASRRAADAQAAATPRRAVHILCVSAKTSSSVERAAANLARYLRDADSPPLAAAALALHAGRESFGHRIAVPASSAESGARALETAIAAAPPPTGPPQVVFMFAGQGSQTPHMGQGLYLHEPRYRAHVDRLCAGLAPLLGFDLREAMYPTAEAEAAEGYRAAFDAPRVTQPAIFVTELALGYTLREVGVLPAALAGHSIGEFVAATLAGVFTEADALSLIAARARLSAAAPEGAMLAASVSAARAEQLAAASPGTLWVAVGNAPKRQVLAGEKEAVMEAQRQLAADGIRSRLLPLPRAYHTPMMSSVQAALAKHLSTMQLSPPSLPLCCNGSGGWMDAATATSASYWAAHVATAVRWTENMAALAQLAPSLVVEVGSGSSLAPLLAESDAGGASQLRSLPTLRHPRVNWADGAADSEVFAEALCSLWSEHVPVDWTAYYAQQKYVRVPLLPTYSFEPAVHWTNASASMYVPSTAAEVHEAQVALDAADAADGAADGAEPLLVRLHAAVDERRWATAYCLAYAGGSTAAFADFAKGAPEWLEVVGVEMPGKGALADTAWPGESASAGGSSVEVAAAEAAEGEMMRRLADRLAVDASGGALVLVGWSMGGMLAAELAAHLHAVGTPPRLLHVAGRMAPGSFVEAAEDIDRYILASEEVRASDAWREWLVPMLMADLRADARAERRAAALLAAAATAVGGAPPLQCEMQICCGSEDPAFPPTDGPAWRAFAAGKFSQHALDGGHDILQKKTDELLELILGSLVPPSSLYAVRWTALDDQPPLEAIEGSTSNAGAATPPPLCLSLGAGSAGPIGEYEASALKSPHGLLLHVAPLDTIAAQEAQCTALLRLLSELGDVSGGGRLVLICAAGTSSALAAGASKAAPLEFPQLAVQRLFLPPELDLLGQGGPLALLPAVVDGWLRWLSSVAAALPFETDLFLPAAGEAPRAPRLLPQPPPQAGASLPVVDPSGTYLISGGSGGLGSALVQWLLVDQHVPPSHLVLLSRRGGAATQPGVRSLKVDVSSADSLAACGALAALPRLGGIFHLAGVLDDGLIMNMDAARVRKVVAPKAGLLPLLERCDELAITPSWVLLASSTSSLLGYAGQANYCAANALFDQAAAFGLPSRPARPAHLQPAPPPPSILTLNFGPWGEVGMASEGTKAHELSIANGERPMPSTLALTCLAEALRSLLTSCAAAPTSSAVREQYMIAEVEWWRSPWPSHALIRDFAKPMPQRLQPSKAVAAVSSRGGSRARDAEAAGSSAKARKGHADLSAEDLRQIESDGRKRAEEWMRGRLSSWEEHRPLSDLGLDSLDLVQLRNAFNKYFRAKGRLDDEVPLSVFSNANQTLSELLDKVGALVA